jgi:hypothetical protein
MRINQQKSVTGILSPISHLQLAILYDIFSSTITVEEMRAGVPDGNDETYEYSLSAATHEYYNPGIFRRRNL